MAAGLVDRVGCRDQVYEGLREGVGHGEFPCVQRYLARAGRPHRRGPTIAQPSAITASVGVVGGKFATADFWEQLGVTWDGVEGGTQRRVLVDGPATHAAGTGAPGRLVGSRLRRLSGRVAVGRGMTDAVARGRIRSGEDALRLGLVDELSRFPTALRPAREAAGVIRPPGALVIPPGSWIY